MSIFRQKCKELALCEEYDGTNVDVIGEKLRHTISTSDLWLYIPRPSIISHILIASSKLASLSLRTMKYPCDQWKIIIECITLICKRYMNEKQDLFLAEIKRFFDDLHLTIQRIGLYESDTWPYNNGMLYVHCLEEATSYICALPYGHKFKLEK